LSGWSAASCWFSRGKRNLRRPLWRGRIAVIFHRGDAEDAEKSERQGSTQVADHRLNDLSGEIIGACIEVHRSLGPGLLESAYEECLCHELALREIPFERQVTLPVKYKGVKLDCGYRLDLVVDKRIVVELKAVESVTDLHRAQLITYLKLLDCRLGLLINFNVAVLKEGIVRVALGAPDL